VSEPDGSSKQCLQRVLEGQRIIPEKVAEIDLIGVSAIVNGIRSASKASMNT
jgi:hypothetical protein